MFSHGANEVVYEFENHIPFAGGDMGDTLMLDTAWGYKEEAH